MSGAGNQGGMAHSHDVAGRYYTLDGIRGIAAFIVVTLHAPALFGERPFPRAYLAVDLFFMLSGFVIADAYQARLESGMSWSSFMRARLTRLYPLYAAGLVLGIIAALFGVQQPGAPAWTSETLALAILPALLMLPSMVGAHMFPLNTPSWSLWYELMANAAYGVLHARLRGGLLVALILLSGAGLALFGRHYGYLALGYNRESVVAGLCRVTYPFLVGVLIWRMRRTRRVAPALALLAAILSGAVLAMPLPADPFDMIAALALFPLLVWFAAHVEPDARIAPLFAWGGAISYGVYTLHEPLAALVSLVIGAAAAPWSGIVFLAALAMLVTLIDRAYDQPVRRAISQWGRHPSAH